jgi:hypothetical protein
MSSSLLNVGRLDRKFVQESAGNSNEPKLKYSDPSFVTFRILFDFEPIVSNDEVMQGLLLNEARDESAVSYLRRMGELERGEILKEFIWLLSRISNDFPWFFKSISNISSLWNWGFVDDQGSTDGKPVDIDIECYETVDLRITALADLYRKATRDRRYFRELLTMDKKRFNMTIIMGEARNLRTFLGSNETDWLDSVSAVAFRCLDCEFDFSDIIPNTLSASDAPTNPSPKFSIRVHRVQETNSYRLLNYMLGEIKRDLVIRQGGSGAEVNQLSDIIDYRSLISPLVRTYEGNYQRVLNDLNRNISQNFVNRLTFMTGDRTSTLPYRERERLNVQQLNRITKQSEFRSTADLLLASSLGTTNIINEQSLIAFGRPTVDSDISEGVDFSTRPTVDSDISEGVDFSTRPTVDSDISEGVDFSTRPTVDSDISEGVDLDPEKIEDAVAQQIEFLKPKVETELSDFSFNRPSVETNIEDNVGLVSPTIQTDISSDVNLIKPTVGDKPENNMQFNAPTVETRLEENIEPVRPTVQNALDASIQFERPTVETNIESVVGFGRPSVAEAIDGGISFVKPTVLGDITEKITFEKPKVEDDFGS